MAKRSLGQNFLTSEKIVADIVGAANLSREDIVLEIGPGKGVLTKGLLEKVGKVIAIEKDDGLFKLLSEKFEEEIRSKKLELIHGNALVFEKLPEKYKLVANIPYNITGEILRKFLSMKSQPELVVLMLQKEVVDRILERDGKGSILSNSIKVYGKPRLIKKVPASFFKPKPKVDSAILKIENISKKAFQDVSEEKFFEILKTGFRHKRKTLSNNLSVYKNHLEALEKCSIRPQSRAEELSIEDWLCLSKNL